MMTDREKQNVRYWNDFCDELKSRGSQFHLQFPTYREAHYIKFRIEKKCGVMVRQVIKPKPGELSVVFYIHGSNAITFFDALKEQQVKIEEKFGESLEWWGNIHHGEQRLGLIKADVNPADETDWPNQHEWLATKLEKLNEVFRPRIMALNAGDWQPPKDIDTVEVVFLEDIDTEEESFLEETEALPEQLTREFAETRDVLKSVVEEIRGVREDLKIIRTLLGDIV